MSQLETNPYLRTKIMTASPAQLRLMLYDGALRHCRAAREGLARRDYEASYEGVVRAQKIVLELSNGLDHTVEPELCDRLAALYNYIYRRLVEASMRQDTAALDECIRLIGYERETWQMVMEQAGEGEAHAGGPAEPEGRWSVEHRA